MQTAFGSVSSITDEPPDQANRAVVILGRTPPDEVDRNVFHASVGQLSKEELLAESAKPMDVK